MSNVLLYIAAALILLVSCFHSVTGHRRLVAPLLAMRNGMLADDRTRAIILFAWHAATPMMLLFAVYLALAASAGVQTDGLFVGLIGLLFAGLAMSNGVLTRFAHPGWLIFAAIATSIFLSFLL